MDTRWLLLIHQIPPKPNYFRVKIWRRLQRTGAVAIKNSVYVLPVSDAAQEDLQWVLREITAGGGDATICEARFIDGLRDDQVEALFHAARDADYAQIAEDARRLSAELPASPGLDEARRAELLADLTRLRRRLADVVNIDFFGAHGREAAEGLLAGLEARARPLGPSMPEETGPTIYQGRTWVTRKGIHVDRIACAWLIRRFIDPAARFKFVPGKGYAPHPGELRFDMFEAEFTHEGDRCSFEVLRTRLGLADPALDPIAEIVHDIDLKDAKFGRPEAPGIAALLAGLAKLHREDEVRLEQGAAIFNALYEHFRRSK